MSSPRRAPERRVARKSAPGTPRPLIEFGGRGPGDAGGTHAAGPTKREPTNLENRNAPPPLPIEVEIIPWERDAGTWGVSYRWGTHHTSEKIGSRQEAEAY